LWLAYSAIFANPAGAMNNATLAAAGIAVIVFAVWARATDRMQWQSATNIVLSVMLLLVAAARWAMGMAPLSFWIILLVGIAVAIAAMGSMLYRPETAQSRVVVSAGTALLRRSDSAVKRSSVSGLA
jgi:hypothetical protein